MNWKPFFRTKSIEKITSELTPEENGQVRLKKSLGVWDLTALGVAAI
jgi:hypothetical protein